MDPADPVAPEARVRSGQLAPDRWGLVRLVPDRLGLDRSGLAVRAGTSSTAGDAAHSRTCSNSR
ncbi:hypothetical protein MBOU_35950 [Mycobacterium bourgelatii]|uniref:Uncharacterized protein n=1 Tax=Mycobacterium bourgelatii TaxID=1273442 RepID=A0A7I9YSP7_MYCBU|nr:hypothetical protein MBOU_35950 [Mycobacterium bourgelatii]